QAVAGCSGSEITGVSFLGGLRGAFRMRMSNGRSLIVKLEDLAPARFGADLAEAQGMVSPQMRTGYSFETGGRDPINGRPVSQEFGIMLDVHDYAAGDPVTVTLPGGRTISATEGRRVSARMPDGQVEEVTVLGVAMLRDEVMGQQPGNPAAIAFWDMRRTPEGRQRIMQAWRSYHEMSRRALLMDRFARNSVAYLVRRPNGEVEITFQPIDLDGIGGRIGGQRGSPDFSGFYGDFAGGTVDLMRMLIHASGTHAGAAGSVAAPDGRPLYSGPQLTSDQLFADFASPAARAGATIPRDQRS